MMEDPTTVLLPLPILYESDEFFSEIGKICDIIPLSTLVKILELQPNAKFEIFRVTNKIKDENSDGKNIDITYARLRKHQEIPEETKNTDWRQYFGTVKDQKDHDICWAIVTVELLKAIRWTVGREAGIDYSYQELVDFVDPEKLKIVKQRKHFCYTSSISKGFSYIMENGIQREVERPFVNCRTFPPPRVILNPNLGFIGSGKKISTIEEALIHLQKYPLGAAFPIFLPDYNQIKEEIYRGPMYKGSRFAAMHAVSITGAGTENGESFMWVRSSHGERIGINGYFRVSIDVMIFRTSQECQKHEENYFQTPTPLLTRFCFPELLDESKENQRKEKIESKLPTLREEARKHIKLKLVWKDTSK